MRVNISVTIKTVDGISLNDGGKLEESERYNYSGLVIWSTLQLTSKQWFITYIVPSPLFHYRVEKLKLIISVLFTDRDRLHRSF